MNGLFRHSVTRAVLCLATILCLLLTACAAAAESGMNDRDALRADFEEITGGSGEELP